MPRWLKISFKIITGAILLILLVLGGLVLYINANEQKLLKQITIQLNENLNGTLTVESMKPEFIRGFPGISIMLKNVLLRDSLYRQHKHDLLQAENVYVSVDVFSILRMAPRIRNVEINRGKIYIFTDSTGYSNTHIFKDRNPSTKKKGKPKINHIFLYNVDLTFENDHKFKLFHLDIHNMESIFDYNPGGWTADVTLSALVKSFAFNTEKGSYIQNKELVINGNVWYDRTKEILSAPEQVIRIGEDDLRIGGTFFFAQKPSTFQLNITAENILFKNAKSLLSPSISSKLAVIDIAKPLNVLANIKGNMKFRDTPVVHVSWTVKDNTLVTPGGEINDCSFTGAFVNQVDTALGHTDDNSKISLYGFKGKWEQIPFTVDTVVISNLVRPVIEGRFRSRFPLTLLNPIIGGHTFAFNKGNVDLNLLYKGGILSDDTTKSYVYGTIQVSSAAMTYLPRRLPFINTSALISFRGSDVFIQDAKVQVDKSILVMNGSMRNFMNLYYTEPGKLLLDWQIRSSRIDLAKFLVFLAARQSTISAQKPPAHVHKTVSQLSQHMDNVLTASSVHMQLQVDTLLYNAFTAHYAKADILLEQSGIVMNNISLYNADGKMAVHGKISQGSAVNSFHLVSTVDDVNIQKFFRSFNNFGQDAVTDKNLRGILDANIDVTGKITDSGKIVPKSFDGIVSFDLRDGALIDFAPFLKVSKYVFRNRNLSNVTFSDLKNKLEIKGDKITINPMLIESSAINLQVRGVYSLSKGTDIDIDIPLRNPKKDELIINDDQREKRDMKGIVIHLKAVDGDDGSVKMKLMLKKQDDPNNPGDQNTAPGKKKLGKRLLEKIRR